MAKAKRSKHRSAGPIPPDSAGERAASESPSGRRSGLIAVVVAGVAIVAGLFWWWDRQDSAQTSRRMPAPTTLAQQPIAAEYVDEQKCATCHATQAGSWRGSHHDLAMQEANASTVLGNFNNAVFSKDGVRTRFFRRDGGFWINTDGPDGKPTDYAVKYTFGVEPLQQYLLELDRGRMQAFTVAWDTQRKRWFHLYPNERIDHKDELHWSKPSQNWNFMCAECHSTDLKKNYDASTRSYRTTWKQIDVGCQACHGPASRHLAWAGQAKADGASRSHGFDVDLSSGDAAVQIETCARCHSRRAPLWGDYRHGKPLMDTHLPSLLDAALYFSDGQIDGEVYEYGSFLQSKMHQKGLRCSDCHEPHSLLTRDEGNALCTSCHNASAPVARTGIDTAGLKHKDYDSPAHHFHKQGEAGSRCVDCHAPQRTYMVVDPRHDHSFRIPRPDLSAKLNTPNACNGCHEKRSAQWATETVAKWYGPNRRQEHTYGETLWAGRTRQRGAVPALAQLVNSTDNPAIVRATALRLLGDYPSVQTFESLRSQLSADSPLLRSAAVNGLEIAPPEQRAPLAAPLLADPVRAVRLDAVRSLAAVPATSLTTSQREQMASGIKEFEAAQLENADQPSSWLNLGNLHAELGDIVRAEADYQSAIALDPAFVPAYVNLADLMSRSGQNPVAIPILQAALESVPDNASLQHALGLALTREKRYDEALRQLSQATRNDPLNARYAFVYGVALHDTGKQQQGVSVLEKALERNPGDRDLLSALAAYAQAAGDSAAVAKYAMRMREIETGEVRTAP